MFIYTWGGEAMDEYADYHIPGLDENLYLGHDVSSAGDLNSDGFDDFMISATGFDSNRGTVYIYNGNTYIDPFSADLILYGQVVQDRFGSSISNAGDLNGDGYDDIIIGAVHQ